MEAFNVLLKTYADTNEVVSQKFYQGLCEKALEQIKELEAELEKHRWIPVNESLPKEGKYLVLCEGKIYEVKVRISEDEWEDNEGKSFMQETACCDIRGLGTVLIGHDICTTHWKPIILPE